jgi:rhodanese-related sulfurtransferase
VGSLSSWWTCVNPTATSRIPARSRVHSASRRLSCRSAISGYRAISCWCSPAPERMRRPAPGLRAILYKGFQQVAVLTGGYPAWLAAGYPIQEGSPNADQLGDG